jgi:hypothetical protein
MVTMVFIFSHGLIQKSKKSALYWDQALAQNHGYLGEPETGKKWSGW